MDVEDNHTLFDFYYFLKENYQAVLKTDANLLKQAIAIVNTLDDNYKDEIIERVNEQLSLDEFASLLGIQKIWVNKVSIYYCFIYDSLSETGFSPLPLFFFLSANG